MNKLGMALGAAAIATLAGCKDPDYKYANAPSTQDDVKIVETEANIDVRPVETKPVEIKIAPVETPVIVTDLSRSTPAGKPVAEMETTYVVQNGDSLSKISKKYNVTLNSILRLNPGVQADKIRISQKIKLPGKVDVSEQKSTAVLSPVRKAAPVSAGPSATYVVKSGDTLGAIAGANGVSVRQLKEANGLKKNTIRVGQKLKIPAQTIAKTTGKKTAVKKASAKGAKIAEKKAATAPAVVSVSLAPAEPAAAPKAEAAPAAETAPAPVVETAPAPAETAPVPVESAPAAASAPAPAAAAPAAAPTATYVVQEGDDMTGVSIRWGVSAAAIRELNNLGENDQLKPGQVIKLPAEAQQ